MALQKKLVSIPFNAGADTKTSDIVMQPGQLEVLENAVFEKTGRIEKRKGCSGSDIVAVGGGPVGSMEVRGTHYLFQNAYNLLYSADTGNAVSLTQGKRNHFETELFSVTNGNGHHQESPSIAVDHAGETIGVAWLHAYYNSATSNINYEYRVTILDASTMVPLVSDLGFTFDARADKVHRGKIKIVAQAYENAADNQFGVYHEYVDAGGNIDLRKLKCSYTASDLSNTTVHGRIAIANSSTYRQTAAETSFDVTEYKQPSSATSTDWAKVHVVFTEYTGSTHKVTYALDTHDQLTSSLSLSDSHDQTGAINGLTVFRSDQGGSGAHTFFSFAVGANLHLRHHDEADSSSGATASTLALGSGYSLIECGGFCDSKDGNTVEWVGTSGTTSSTKNSYAKRIQITPNSATLNAHSDPWRGHVWTPVAPFSDSTASVLVAFMSQENRNTEDQDLSLHSVTGWIDSTSVPNSVLAALGAGYLNWLRGLASVTMRQELIRNHLNEISPRVISHGGSYYTVLPRATNIQTFVDGSGNVSPAINSSCHVIKMTLTDPVYETPRAHLGGMTYLAGGALMATTLEWWQEAGFLYKPGIAVAETAAGSLTSTGTYKYKGVWEWIDGAGNLHRSEPSDPETLTLTSTNTGVTVTADGLSVSTKMVAGQMNLVIYRTQSGGSIYNKVATIEVEDFSADLSPTGLITHTDKVSDANAATGAFLYTEGGELANVAAPASRYVEAHRGRIFVIAEDNKVWFSKEYEAGFGLGFSDSFEIRLDANLQDKPTALCSAGSELYLFREESIWLISGEGPSKTGVGEFYKPRQVSAAVGALMGSPTLYTDTGVYFQNVKGIFRIGQQGVEYIGAPVEDLVGAQRLVGIRLHQSTETIRFALPDKVLSYNYRYNAWSNHTYELAEGQDIVGIENVDEVIYLTTDNDYVLVEDSSYKITNNGSTSYMPLKMKTGWISFNQIQGFGRAYRFALLGESRDKHVLTVKVYYDYDDSSSDTYTFTTSEATDAVLQFRAHLSKQKCQAVKFEIYDADNSATTGDGFAIDQITIEVGTKKGIFRTAQTTNTIGAS